MKSLAQARVKRVRAVQLLIEGRNYDEIARAVGYSHRGSAHHAVATALAAREVEAVDELRALEQVRLDQLQSSMWPLAMAGDLAAITVVLRIIDMRCRLLGLQIKAEPDEPRVLVAGPTS